MLDDFSLTVAPGETVALVGTLGLGQVDGRPAAAALLRRARRARSRIDGVDVRDVTLDSLRRQIGVVFEDSFLFSDTITRQHRLRPARRDRRGDRGRGRAAAEAHEFIPRCPTATTPWSASRGSRCRAASASASRSPGRCSPIPAILLLDDATSSVDARDRGGDPRDAAPAAWPAAPRCSSRTAARRCALADRIVVVDHGRGASTTARTRSCGRGAPCTACCCRVPATTPRTTQADEPDARRASRSTASRRRVAPAQPATAERGAAPSARTRSDRGGPRRAVRRRGRRRRWRRRHCGGGGVGRRLAPTPELLAQVDALPAAPPPTRHRRRGRGRAEPPLQVPPLPPPVPRRLARRACCWSRSTRCTLAGPLLVRHGIDSGVHAARSRSALWAASTACSSSSS